MLFPLMRNDAGCSTGLRLEAEASTPVLPPSHCAKGRERALVRVPKHGGETKVAGTTVTGIDGNDSDLR
jgi:hypothetical protein